MLKSFWYVLLRDLTYYSRRKGEWLFPLLFCLMVCVLFSMVFPFNSSRLAEVAPTLLWVTLMLATILSLESIFQSDFKDGTLEQLMLSSQPFSLLILGKVLAHWLALGLPLTLLAPILAILLQLSSNALMSLTMSVFLGMPILSLVGSIAVALTLGLQRGGIFLAILILPLMMPVLILGTSAVYAADQGLPFLGQLALLLALLIFSLSFAPLTIAAALKIGHT